MNNFNTAVSNVIPYQFGQAPVRALLIEGQPWFFAADICSAVGLSDTNKALLGLDSDEKREHEHYSGSGRRPVLINESGLYSLILRSRKAEAKHFKKWVTAEVLPAIRKHGQYTDAKNQMATLMGETIGTNGFNMLGGLIKGKVVRLPTDARRRATSKVWSQLHTAFGVRSAADIPAEQLDAARNFIAAYALEGEWLPHESANAGLGNGDLINLNALANHVHEIRAIYQKYDLYGVFRRLGSSAGVELHDHIKDGSFVASMLTGKYSEQIKVAKADMRSVFIAARKLAV